MAADLALIDGTVDVFCGPVESGGLDFLPHMPETSGRLALAYRIVRRLSTRHGSLPGLPNDGIDLRAFLLSSRQPTEIERAAREECLKDEQVEQVISVVAINVALRSVSLNLTLLDSEGPFTLTLSISDAAVNLIRIQQEAA